MSAPDPCDRASIRSSHQAESDAAGKAGLAAAPAPADADATAPRLNRILSPTAIVDGSGAPAAEQALATPERGGNVMDRHYATIGIDDVFLVPPSHALPREYFGGGRPQQGPKGGAREGNNNGCNPNEGVAASEEITGVIKASPRDFVVREISPVDRCSLIDPLRSSADQSVISPYPHVADLEENRGAVATEEYDASRTEDRASVQFLAEPLPGRRLNRSERLDHEGQDAMIASTAPCSVDADEPTDRSVTVTTAAPKPPILEIADPHVALKQQLAHTQEGSEEWICRLEALSRSVVEGLKPESERTSSGGETECSAGGSPAPLQQTYTFHFDPRYHPLKDEEGSASDCMPLDRGIFHRSIRSVYPMLSAESSVAARSAGLPDERDQQCDEGQEANGASYQVTVTPDPLFLSLAPLLHEPHVDLPHLYAYYKGGLHATEPTTAGRPAACDYVGVVLRLKPDLPRAERKHVHHAIEIKSSQNLATTTRTIATPTPAAGAELNTAGKATVASIVVQWSKIAHRRLAKRCSRSSTVDANKRKRNRVAASVDSHNQESPPSSSAPAQGEPRSRGEQSSSQDVDKPHSLFVLKKTGVEHLRAQHCLSEMLRCRQADLGLAGIKDTVATTYQFCTVRNYDAARLVRTLQHQQLQCKDEFAGIEIGQVRAVDWLLRKGELDGNRFHIVLRNVRRVQVTFDKDGLAQEAFVPCDVEHVSSRIDSVARRGFCNFYGEQRVGIPGLASIVGVRAFEVGRSMLQQNYRDAVDKIMTGRIITRDYDNREPDDIQMVRQTWKETGGDPHRTWTVLPRGAALARERLILKGLKRYGDPLQAIRCLHFHERMFWISAYQSYVWNAMTSERIRRYGTAVVVGDLVENSENGQVTIVTSESLHSTTLRFEDVVLPLPGYDVLYPTNEVGERYRALLERDAVSFRKDGPPESTAKGSYRRLVSGAYNVSFEALAASGGDGNLDVRLQFDLPTGSYATMFLRELMYTTVVRDNQIGT